MSNQSLPKVALAGNPNSGKTSLFNALTGSRQKVGNYPGVTVERKEGLLKASGRDFLILDLPGTYSLEARTPDEEITRDVLLNKIEGESPCDVILAVADATHLERQLTFVLELMTLQKPLVLAINMIDLSEKRGLKLNSEKLSQALGVPVIVTSAVQGKNIDQILVKVNEAYINKDTHKNITDQTFKNVKQRFDEVQRVLSIAVESPLRPASGSQKIDKWVLHPITGSLTLFLVFTLVFQAVFTWAAPFQDAIESMIGLLANQFSQIMPDGVFESLIVDGVIAGVGSVVVFLPQILFLYLFILFLEDSGYMSRAAFLMDKLMGRVGLHGRAFIPLLSSFACAIPGIMATRTIENKRDRLTTILVAPLMTCSARLPVYALLIGAFIPQKTVMGFIGLQGLVLFSLYFIAVILALLMAMIFKRTLLKAATPPLLLELPTYKWPNPKSILIGLKDRAVVFLKRAGTVIMAISIVLWFLSSYPKAPEGAQGTAIEHSYAGKIGKAIEPVIKPLGFDWRIGIAFIPGFAAREVMVSALATVYSVEGKDEEETSSALGEVLKSNWSLATAMSLLVWYIIACQCLSTIAVVKRETNSWRWPIFMLVYLTVLAYLGSFFTFQVFSRIGL